MKMPEAQFEIVLFDARDVIATSGGGGIAFDDTGLPTIWLTPTSVMNYNAMASARGEWTLYSYPDDKNKGKTILYYGYGFEFFLFEDQWFTRGVVEEGGQIPPKGIIDVAANDFDKYLEIFNWPSEYGS